MHCLNVLIPNSASCQPCHLPGALQEEAGREKLGQVSRVLAGARKCSSLCPWKREGEEAARPEREGWGLWGVPWCLEIMQV